MSNFHNLLLLLFFLLITTVSIFFSVDPILSLHKIIHSVVWVFWGVAGFYYLLDNSIFVKSLIIITFSAVIQGMLAFYQFFEQKSFGLSWLGESVISPTILGVAKIDFLGQKIIRAYGTFSHPNVLGAFLILSIACCFFIIHKKIRGIEKSNCSTWNNLKKIDHLFFVAGIFFLTLSLFLTFSRASFMGLSIVLVSAFAIGNNFIRKISAIVLLFFLVLGSIFSPLISSRIRERQTSNNSDQALRLIYIQKAKNNIAQNPLVGTGPGTFVITLQEDKNSKLNPWELQPVHNIYLLTASDFGIPFLCLIVFLLSSSAFLCLKKTWGSFNFLLIILLLVYLAIGFFDHFMYSFSPGIAIIVLLMAKMLSSCSLSQTDCSTWNNKNKGQWDSLFHVEQ